MSVRNAAPIQATISGFSDVFRSRKTKTREHERVASQSPLHDSTDSSKMVVCEMIESLPCSESKTHTPIIAFTRRQGLSRLQYIDREPKQPQTHGVRLLGSDQKTRTRGVVSDFEYNTSFFAGKKGICFR